MLYLTTTYIKVVKSEALDTMVIALDRTFKSAATDNSSVEVDEVRATPSLSSVAVTLRVEAGGAEEASGEAQRVYETAMNLLGDDADGLIQRQSSLVYA